MAQLFNKVTFNSISLFLQHTQRVRLSLDVSVFRFICCKTMIVYAIGLLDRDFKCKILILVGVGPAARNSQTLNSFWICICFTYGAGARLTEDFVCRRQSQPFRATYHMWSRLYGILELFISTTCCAS